MYALRPVVMEHVSALEHASLKTTASIMLPHIVQENLYKRKIVHYGVAQVSSDVFCQRR